MAWTLHITAVGHRGVTMSQLSPAHLQSSARRESRGSKQREQAEGHGGPARPQTVQAGQAGHYTQVWLPPDGTEKQARYH